MMESRLECRRFVQVICYLTSSVHCIRPLSSSMAGDLSSGDIPYVINVFLESFLGKGNNICAQRASSALPSVANN